MKNKINKPTAARQEPRPTGYTEAATQSMRVAYGLIRPDPNQPRKTFTEASLNELADSIREQGIIQPLILEFVPAKFKIEEPDLHSKDYHVRVLVDGVWQHAHQNRDRKLCEHFCESPDNLIEHYRIVAGERRWRAAGIVKLADVPAVVHRGLTDKQRFAIQFIENNQRENVSALEEAEAMKTQLASRRLEKPEFSPEELAKELGISRAGLYERLKLTRLHPPVRVALLAGKISTSVAGEVAKLPTPAAQEKLLKEIIDALEDDMPMSVRELQGLIQGEYVRQLSDAPFDLKDENIFTRSTPREIAKLPPGIYIASCLICPHRTGNMLAEFPELKTKPNVCTNPVCFGEKCKAHWLVAAADAQAKGQKVFTEKEFKSQRGDYIAGDKHEYAHNKNGTFTELMGKHAPEPVLVSTAEGLKKFYPKAEVPKALKAAGVKLYSQGVAMAETQEQKAKREAKEKEVQQQIDRRQALVIRLAADAARGLKKIKDEAAWKLLDSITGSDRYLHDDFDKALYPLLKDPRSLLLADSLSRSLRQPTDRETGEWDKEDLAIWLALGVDLKAEEKKHDKQKSDWVNGKIPLDQHPDQKLLVEVSANPKSKKKMSIVEIAKLKPKSKFKMSAAAKARIVAAHRARWAKIKATK